MDKIPIKPTIDDYNLTLLLIPIKPSKTLNANLREPVIPIKSNVDTYNLNQPLIPIKQTIDNYSNTLLIPVEKSKSTLLKRILGFINQKPWLASFSGILELPPVLKSYAPLFLLPALFGMVANSIGLVLNNPTPQKMVKTALKMVDKILERKSGKYKYRYLTLPKTVSQQLSLSITRSVTLWKNVDGQSFTYDPATFQIESYTKDLISGGSYDKNLGDIIKFSIYDVNRQQTMITPAFILTLSDGGLSGNWLLVLYVNGTYPKFQYKGSTKRTISFTLKLGCFSKKYLNVYVNKLNFLRRVGLPFYLNVSINDSTFSYPKAPLYKLTLGDIIVDQYGYFESCLFSWDDLQTTWNLDNGKLWKVGGESLVDITNDYLLPIVTSLQISFVCMYGTVPTDLYIKGSSN